MKTMSQNKLPFAEVAIALYFITEKQTNFTHIKKFFLIFFNFCLPLLPPFFLNKQVFSGYHDKSYRVQRGL